MIDQPSISYISIDDVEREERISRVWHLYERKGYEIRAIARALGITRCEVNAAIDESRRRQCLERDS